ncbi:MAG: alpha-E domain-containing protein [Betaproteobacteria bacterium]|nr:alpha-E domain-containing protein [Betaproteobacteria bacterium]
MLSRTAENLYWMARHIERAENTARLLDVTYHSLLLPGNNQYSSPTQSWEVPLMTMGLVEHFYELYDQLTPENILQFLVTSSENHSSIFSSLSAARENARTVRGAITSEMWESINSTWLEFKDITDQLLDVTQLAKLFDRVKRRSHVFRGVTLGTALHDEAYHFIRLGSFMERADNTARILDIKYHILLPTAYDVGGAVDYYQWGALLKSVSAFEAYRKIYRDVIDAEKVAELLILRMNMPRSLHACLDQIDFILDTLRTPNNTEARRLSGELHAKLHYGQIKTIIKSGLHEYLIDFINDMAALSMEINHSFFAIHHDWYTNQPRVA